jgi:choline dehydrogenase-like flavoprotein
MAAAMGWSEQKMRMYYQAALDLMPMCRSVPGEREAFFDAVVETLTSPGPNGQPAMLRRMPKGHFDAQVEPDSIAEASLAMYESAARWTPAYLVSEGVRPSNLLVITHADVDRVLIEHTNDSGSLVNLQQQHQQPNANSSTQADTTFVESASSGLAAKSVLFRHHGEWFDARLDDAGEAIVAAGSLHTPAILQRSGIGPADLLKKHGITPLVDNPEVGHGVDHNEIAVIYDWLDKWNNPLTGDAPRGGVMGWPLVLFASLVDNEDQLIETHLQSGSSRQHHPHHHHHHHVDDIPITQAHFGAGFAEPYTSGLAVVASPNCVLPHRGPNGHGGFRVQIGSRDPSLPALVIAGDESSDYMNLVRGLRRIVQIFERLRAAGVVGDRIEPPKDLDLNDTEKVIGYIKARHGTAYHWMSTCQAGQQVSLSSF